MSISPHCRRISRLLLRTLWLVALSLSFAVSPAPAAEAVKGVDLSTAIVKVAKQAIPSVVHIAVTESREVANPFLPFADDPFFRRFFNVPQMPKKFKRELQGIGTGIILDTQGHILTNHHVAGGASKIEIQLSSGERYPAQVVGTDPKTDLAVLKISAKGPLPYATFGDSDKAEVGEWVVAIGHPRGLNQTVTQGIISAKHRAGISDPGSYQDFLQTDAAVNPGNSGGPLLNLRGEVIGVNAVIISQSGGYEGIGFTIPSNMALYISKALIAHGKVIRGWAGVSIQDLTPELAKTAGAGSAKGVYVADVVKGGPAEKAGIRKGDVLTAYGGKDVSDSAALRNAVAATPVGREVKVAVLREGKKFELTIRIENLELLAKAMAAEVKDRLGAEVRAVSPAEARKYGLENRQGAVITSLETSGALGEAGFEVGDIILAIDNRPVADLDAFVQLASALKPNSKAIVLGLDHRTGNMGNVEVTVR
ncbi:MAG TPA: trypsin-like peptidase domain-containing protein [Syntrophales bacterium]|nr:trypsin-like peptidase domain-containing protein [Syntrophales bacterium]